MNPEALRRAAQIIARQVITEERRREVAERCAVAGDEASAQLRERNQAVRHAGRPNPEWIWPTLETCQRGCERSDRCKERYRSGYVMLPVVPVAVRIGGVLVRSIDRRVVHRLPGGRPNSLDEVGAEWSPGREVQDRMHHPQWQAGLLEVGETEVPGEILRINHIADTESQRLAPGHDLPTREQRQRPHSALPVRVPDVVLVVIV